MRFSRIVFLLPVTFAMAMPAFAYSHARRGPTAGLFKKRSSRSTMRSTSRPVGPRAMDSERATQIQAALIKTGYLTGTPSGRWDSESEIAMQKLQGEQGWQTKITPDSRALILLGLGPKEDQQALLSSSSVSATESNGENSQ